MGVVLLFLVDRTERPISSATVCLTGSKLRKIFIEDSLGRLNYSPLFGKMNPRSSFDPTREISGNQGYRWGTKTY